MADELGVALEAAEAAATLLLDHLDAGVDVEWKGPKDPVTPADRAAEALVRERIALDFPDDIVVGEEGAPITEAEVTGRRRWYVDPLDGTMNFIKGRRRFAVAVAFCDADDVLRTAVIVAPALGDTYLAERGGGATLDGRRLVRAEVAGISQALVSVGAVGGAETLPAVAALQREALSLRVDGSSVLDMGDVATGRSDAFWTTSSERWDLAAGTLVCAEAGAVVTDLAGQVVHGPTREVLAAAPGVHGDLLALLTR